MPLPDFGFPDIGGLNSLLDSLRTAPPPYNNALTNVLGGALGQQPQNALMSGPATANQNMLSQAMAARQLPQNYRAPDLLEQSRQQFPYLRNAPISLVMSDPSKSEGRMLESWAPGDMGWEWKGKRFDRPSNLAPNSVGLEIFDRNTKPIDILGDYVSHTAVNSDPNIKKLYDQFSALIPDSTMLERYKWDQENAGEKRPFEEWKNATGLPAMFRGYTFNQWGPEANKYYSPQQLQVLDKVRNYLGIK